MNIGDKIINGKFTVIGIMEIVNYGKSYVNTNIVCEICAVGKRGGLLHGYLFTNGKIKLDRVCEMWRLEGEYIYDGTTGVRTKKNEAVEFDCDFVAQEELENYEPVSEVSNSEELEAVENESVDVSEISNTILNKFGIGNETTYSNGNLFIKFRDRHAVLALTTAVRFDFDYTTTYKRKTKEHIICLHDFTADKSRLLAS